ncbi:membrane protein [Streptomyces flavidovirens]|uniref:membrane protein n=1 Tax=Streptomyces flavidovirens TaxID=67298 RepID=UPI00040F35D1|nr:membrane protein [Streptomyces flavidovirens]
MHMNSSAPHLLAEDRPEFERVLDEALRTAHHRPELSTIGQRLNSTQLRTMAMNASALIAAAAAAEYDHYVKVREEMRTPPAAADNAGSVLAMGDATTETTGAGAAAVVAVLTPVLAGTASVIFLIAGYLLTMLTPEPAFARTLLTAGWIFAALAAAGFLAAAVGLLLTALRNGSTAYRDGRGGERNPEVERAGEAWRHALLERGVVPFLRAALAEPGTGPAAPAPRRPAGRIPDLGYSRPDYSSPGPDGGTTPGPRPSFSSPDFSSPDFGGPDHKPE